jgi:hypothetical protein
LLRFRNKQNLNHPPFQSRGHDPDFGRRKSPAENLLGLVKIEQTVSISRPKMDLAAGRRNEEEMDTANAPSA